MPIDVIPIAADILRASEATPSRIAIEPIVNTTLATAYAIQLETAKFRLQRGDIQIGYKVGCTSKPIQAQMGIHEPIFGRLFEQHRLVSPQSIDRNEFDGLAIEGELAVELDLDPRDLTNAPTNIEKAISRVFPVIELHNFGSPADVLNAPTLVANNAIHAGFIQTQEHRTIHRQNNQSLTIYFDGKVVSTVPFEDLEKTILDSLSWLRKELISRDKTPRLNPPITVLCGSVAPLFRVTDAMEVKVSFGELDGVRCHVR